MLAGGLCLLCRCTEDVETYALFIRSLSEYAEPKTD